MTEDKEPTPTPGQTKAPIALDDRRGMAAQKATVIRREQLQQFQSDQQALQRRQDELEALLLAAPAETWPGAAAKAIYLIQLYAATQDAAEPRRKRLVEQTLSDLQRLSERDDPPDPVDPQS
ncbi:MAG: hypothetical protein RIM80_03195 [Alphaproteobacteria bacterium]